MERPAHDYTKLPLAPKAWIEQLDEIYEIPTPLEDVDELYENALTWQAPDWDQEPGPAFSAVVTRQEVEDLAQRLDTMIERIQALEKRRRSRQGTHHRTHHR